MAEATSGSGTGLVEFLEWAGSKGEMAPATAAARASAVRQILANEAEDLGAVDVRTLDVEAVLDRFETKNRTKFSPGSLDTYRSRFRQSVVMYLAWLQRDPDWKNAGRVQPAPRHRSQAKARQPARSSSRARPTESTSAGELAQPEPATSNGMVVYDLPLRPDLLVRLNLPVDLTTRDADRISAFVRSLAFDVPGTDGGDRRS